MPIYEYRCKKCSKIFEKLQKIDEGGESLECPYCGGKGSDRMVSRFASAREEESAPSCGPPGGGSSRFS